MEKRRFKLTVLPENRLVEFKPGERLKKVLDKVGIFLTYPCGGRGDCGKCQVNILEGEFSEPTAAERLFIPQEKLQQGHRLACQFVATGDARIYIPPASREEAGKILVESRGRRRIRFAPAVKKIFLGELAPATIERQISDAELVGDKIRARKWSLSALQNLPLTLRESRYKLTATLYNDCVVEIKAGDTSQRVYGVAVDIGTATIAAALIDLHKDMMLGRKARLNPQRRLGADVISRLSLIVDAMNKTGESSRAQAVVKEFQHLVVSSLQELIASLCAENSIALEEIYEIVCAGNTVMSHLLLGVNPQYLGLAPFVGVYQRGQIIKASELDLRIHPQGMVYVLPNIGGFVGGDIVADMIIAGIDIAKGPVMLIDIGTNGEVVIKGGDGKLWATSAAAGPAFEGAQISQGVQASPGAIDRIFVSADGSWKISTIAGERPIGLCGSGVVSAIAEFCRAGFIESSGRILPAEEIQKGSVAEKFCRRITSKNEEAAILLAGEEENALQPIYLTQNDVRELQLAKGAIATAQAILLRLADVDPTEIQTLFIAGAFGNYIVPEDAQYIGLVLPEIPGERIKFIGNAALAGATLLLRSQRCRQLAEEIAAKTQFIELANRPDFQNTFMLNLSLH